MARQIILDTETTGLNPEEGHRIIEVGCIELLDRNLTGNDFHEYINPERKIDAGASAIHGIKNEFLLTKPKFPDIVEKLISYLTNAELIIHNAPFDIGFLRAEFCRISPKLSITLENIKIIDTLALARKMHPGQRNNLDALCKRYKVDNSKRELHGALLDATLLAELYLKMTGGQGTLISEEELTIANSAIKTQKHIRNKTKTIPIQRANATELLAHQNYLMKIKQQSSKCLWDE